MRPFARLMLVCSVAVCLPALSLASPAAKKAVKSAPLVCPVTGEKIASVKEAVGHSTYKGKTYYFCCAMCKPMFDKNPAKYVKSVSHRAN